MMNEIWKDVKGYEGLYQISNLGRIKSLKRQVGFIERDEKILKPRLIRSYLVAHLFKNNVAKNVLIHRMVAEMFIENPENKPCVNHIDGNKQNNKVENLEWVTHSENDLHAYKLGLRKSPSFWKNKKGELHPRSNNYKGV